MKIARTLSVAMIAATLAGCAIAIPNASPNVYRLGEAMQQSYIEEVTVVRLRGVTVSSEGDYMSQQSAVPAAVGAGFAALVSYGVVGKGNGRYVAGAVAAPLGALAAQQVSQVISRRQGVEIIVQKANGQLVGVVQDADQMFSSGERVFLVNGPRGYRVTR